MQLCAHGHGRRRERVSWRQSEARAIFTCAFVHYDTGALFPLLRAALVTGGFTCPRAVGGSAVGGCTQSLTRESVHVLPSFASGTFLAFRFLGSFWIGRGICKSFVLWIWLCRLRAQRAVLRSLACHRARRIGAISRSLLPGPQKRTRNPVGKT